MTQRRNWLIGSAAVALAVYAFMWVGYASQWGWLSDIDSTALDTAYRFGLDNPGWVVGWDLFCTVLGPTAFRLLGVIVIVVALARRNLRVALFLVISVELSGIVTEIAKLIVDRPRPETALVSAMSSSFPSGHALGVTVCVLAFLTVTWPILRPSLRPWLVVAGVVLIVMIGAGRVVLNVHHPSDVLAGWALGYAWFAACLLWLPPTRPITSADEIPAAPGSAH